MMLCMFLHKSAVLLDLCYTKVCVHQKLVFNHDVADIKVFVCAQF